MTFVAEGQVHFVSVRSANRSVILRAEEVAIFGRRYGHFVTGRRYDHFVTGRCTVDAHQSHGQDCQIATSTTAIKFHDCWFFFLLLVFVTPVFSYILSGPGSTYRPTTIDVYKNVYYTTSLSQSFLKWFINRNSNCTACTYKPIFILTSK